MRSRPCTAWGIDGSSEAAAPPSLMSLRLKLLLLGLATLVLPWAGCQYAREMESALREGQRQSLLAMAQTLAASLQGRTDLLYRAPADAASAAAAPPGPYDLEPIL